MTRPGARLNTVVRRMTVGLLAVAVTGLLAPVAAATPESDADAAVTAAWDASGGDGGPLGPREGDVYAAGPGFVQDFAGGKMFFTAATGAHYMQGAILEKYEAQGGPEGDLGFPTIDEGAGLAPDSRNSTLSGPDNPVIFWTPATGARVVRGAINAAWDKLGGSSGVLGVPSEDEAYRGDVISQKFTGGEVSWNRKTKAFTTVPPELADQLAGLAVPDDPASAIAAASRAAGGDMGPLGAKDGDQYPIGNTGGIGQNYARGKVFYTPDTGANAITGQLLDKYESVGGPEGDLGFPTSSETDGGFGQNSRMVTFAAADKPVIFLTPDYGAVIVRGAMNAAWDKLGGAQGDLGAPMADQTEDGNVITQRFSGGAVSWDRSDNTFTTEPSNLSSELAGLQVPGLDQPPPPGGPQTANADEAKPFSWHWNWWWLLALIPVLVLAALIVGAALWHRRRGRDDDEFDQDPFDDDQYGAYDDRRVDDDRYPERGYDEGSYDQRHQEAHRYDDEHYTEETGAGSPNPYPPAGDYESDEPTTSRLTDGYHQTQGASPFDGPTDVAMPVSQWASPTGAGVAAHDPEDDDEEAIELFGGRDEPDAEFATDFDDDFDNDEIDDADYLDAPDSFDVEAESGDDDEAEAELEAPQQGLGMAAADFDDPDNVDTAPTRIETLPRYEVDTETHSGRHAAIELDEPVPSATAIHLPLEDPYRAPEGYPIKADTKSGQYWPPDSAEYDDAVAEIWFASEEFARTNGFFRAD